jgi:hypothetical protein
MRVNQGARAARRVVIAFVVVLGACALWVPAAVAHGVEVQNPGHHELESELNWGLLLHQGGVDVPFFFCDYEWEIDVRANGHFEIGLGVVPHAGQSVFCNGARTCDGVPWEGEIVEDGSGFEAHFVGCFEGTGLGLIDGIAAPIECPMTDGEIHCDWPVGSGVEVTGEITVHGELGLTHVG